MDEQPGQPGGPPGVAPATLSPRRAWLLWGSGALFLLALTALTYPKTYAITDEACYLSTARDLLSGRAFDRSSEAWFWKAVGDNVYQRTLFSASPTFASLLVPFVAMGWRSAFLIGVSAHVLAFGGMIYVLRRRGLDPLWALLYLLHPTLVLYSRTIMADVPVAALMVLVLVLLHRERPRCFLAGLVLALATLLKWSAAFVVAAFVGVMVLRGLARWWRHDAGADGPSRAWPYVVLGLVPVFIVLGIVNSVFFNGPLGNGYVGQAEGWFRMALFPGHLAFYAAALMTIYPFMLVSPAFLRGPYRWEMGMACLTAILVFSAYFFLDVGNSWYEALVRGLRFQQVVLPFYLVAYASMMTVLARKLRWQKAVGVLLIASSVVAAAADAAVCRQHVRYAAREWDRQVRLSRALPADGTILAEPLAIKYLNPMLLEKRRVLRMFGKYDAPWLVRGSGEPGMLLVLVDLASIRTVAYRRDAEAERERLVGWLRRSLDLQPYDRRVEGFEIFRLVPKPLGER